MNSMREIQHRDRTSLALTLLAILLIGLLILLH